MGGETYFVILWYKAETPKYRLEWREGIRRVSRCTEQQFGGGRYIGLPVRSVLTNHVLLVPTVKQSGVSRVDRVICVGQNSG